MPPRFNIFEFLKMKQQQKIIIFIILLLFLISYKYYYQTIAELLVLNESGMLLHKNLEQNYDYCIILLATIHRS